MDKQPVPAQLWWGPTGGWPQAATCSEHRTAVPSLPPFPLPPWCDPDPLENYFLHSNQILRVGDWEIQPERAVSAGPASRAMGSSSCVSSHLISPAARGSRVYHGPLYRYDTLTGLGHHQASNLTVFGLTSGSQTLSHQESLQLDFWTITFSPPSSGLNSSALVQIRARAAAAGHCTGGNLLSCRILSRMFRPF